MMRPSGPTPAKIFLLGEAPGEEEVRVGLPFVGASGQELTRMLSEAGIDRSSCFITNTFHERPEHNDLKHFLVPRKALPPGYNLPAVERGKFLDPRLSHNLSRLQSELIHARPNIVVALGNTAAWAMLGQAGITALRGYCAWGAGPGVPPGLRVKVIPTFHPAAVLRQWSYRPIVIADLQKAKAHSESPLWTRKSRKLWLEPTMADLIQFFDEHLTGAQIISLDIETEKRQITRMSISPDPGLSLVLPFVDRAKPGYSYWSPAEEPLVWDWVAKVCSLPQPKLFQNGLYDAQYLWRVYGIPVRNFSEDTMLIHHSIQPEFPKSLGFLGSIYLDEMAWKTLRKEESLKRDE